MNKSKVIGKSQSKVLGADWDILSNVLFGSENNPMILSE
jgi:hypothetical protein